MSFTPLYQYWTFHFSQRKLTVVKYYTEIHTLQRATRWPMNPFRVLSQGAGLSQELSTTSNLNLFPPFCKPRVYTGLAPGSCLSWQWLVVAHTHTREVCWNDSCVWTLEVVGELICVLTHQYPWSRPEPGGQGRGSWLISTVCYGSGGECAVSQVWSRSGCCPPRHLLPLDWAFGLPMWPNVLRNSFWWSFPHLINSKQRKNDKRED